MTQSAVMTWNLAFSAGAGALGFALVSPRFALGLAVGALLEIANFRSMWRSCERIFLYSANGAGPAVATFGLRYTVIERDPDVVKGLAARGVPAYYGDAGRRDMLERAGARQASLIIVALPDFSTL